MVSDEKTLENHEQLERTRKWMERMAERSNEIELERLAAIERKRRTKRRDRIAEALFLTLIEAQAAHGGLSVHDLPEIANYAYAGADALESARKDQP